ncbi:MAG: M20/M25/M40 family metallo-hydrolase [Meiothermus sp.]|nr:M20/M25/M40 family metallo-hydrolase [Meiothermus sp.]
MNPLPPSVTNYARVTLERLVSLPTVSAEGRALPETAALVRELLEELGLVTELHPTAGAPVVFAHNTPIRGGGAKTVLFYNHYDVQPADPLELWESDPFTLTERDGKLYGRGSTDDKGEITARLAALRWIKEERGEIPFGVKFCIEGEEEVGSPNLGRYVEEYKQSLKADAVLWEAGGVTAEGDPAIYCGLKGIVGLELRCKIAAFDLHSANGAIVQNPLYRLAAAVASLRDKDGRVLVKGFYDRVRPLTELEQEMIARVPDESPKLKQTYGLESFLGGATGLEVNRRYIAEPALNINGFHGGYGGPGSKTVLPAEGLVKMDIRLVPDQDPSEVAELVQAHLTEHGFDDIELIRAEFGEPPARSDLASSWVRVGIEAAREVYGREPVVYPNMAGSGPMHPFVHHLGAPVIGLGCGYPGSRIHSPNEHVVIQNFHNGIAAIKRALEKFAEI